jgi:ammonium transporter Rh
MKKCFKWLFLLSVLLLTGYGTCFAADIPPGSLTALTDVQKYNRAIHIMAMLLVGFGFLMVFVKKYGRSALTATYLLVSVAIPLYFLKDSFLTLGGADNSCYRFCNRYHSRYHFHIRLCGHSGKIN